jgi:hypothetical protein
VLVLVCVHACVCTVATANTTTKQLRGYRYTVVLRFLLYWNTNKVSPPPTVLRILLLLRLLRCCVEGVGLGHACKNITRINTAWKRQRGRGGREGVSGGGRGGGEKRERESARERARARARRPASIKEARRSRHCLHDPSSMLKSQYPSTIPISPIYIYV